MASLFQEFLEDWDMFGTSGCILKQRGILLVDNIDSTGCSLTARQLVPPGVPSILCANDFMQCDEERILGTVSLLWDCNWNRPLPDEKTFLINAVDAHAGHSHFPKAVDFVIDQDTIIVPCIEKPMGPVRILELFAGGFGGWACALRVLKHQGNPAQVVAIDHDLDACKTYAISHGAALINGMGAMDSRLFLGTNQDFIVHADVTAKHWLRPVGMWSPEIFVVSSPCPPWSHASSGAGLEAPDGQLMMNSIALAKILRPRAILLEQVNGFNDHPHKTFLVRLFRWAGYSLHWSRVIDASAWCGTTRKRWLAMLIKIGDDRILPMPFEMWPRVHNLPTPSSLDAVLEPDLALDDRLKLQGFALDVSSRHELLPPAKRAKTPQSEVLSSRCVSSGQQAPTFMASYGSQHDFSIDFLKQRGLMAHYLLSDTGLMRFWHPIEILFLHCAVGFHFIPSDWCKAWRFLGNQICVPHALLLLANTFRMMPSRCIQHSVESAFQQMLQLRLSAGTCSMSVIDAGHFVSNQPIQFDTSLLQAIRELVQNTFEIPVGQCWLLSKGGLCDTDELPKLETSQMELLSTSQEIRPTQVSQITASAVEEWFSPTMPFVPIVKGLVHLRTCSLSFWAAADLSPDAFAVLLRLPLSLSSDFPEDIEHSFHLVISGDSKDLGESGDVLCYFHNGVLNFFEHCQASWDVLSQNGDDSIFDIFGRLTSMPHDVNPIVFGFSPLGAFVTPSIDQLAVFAASALATVSWHFENSDMTIQILFHGSVDAVKTLLDFWGSVLSSIGLSQFGWTFRPLPCVGASDSYPGFVLFSIGPCCPVPSQALWILIVTAGFRTLIASSVSIEGSQIKLKWLSRPVWEGCLPVNVSLSVLTKAMEIASIKLQHESSLSLRLVHQGKNISIEQTIGDCKVSDGRITLHFVPELHGGAPSTSSKTGFQTQVRNALASTLLQEGFELKWVTSAIDQAVAKIGIKTLAPIAAKTHGTQRLSAIKESFSGAGIEIPLVKPAVSSASSLRAKAKKHLPPAPDAKNYKALPGYLLNEDGTQATQLWELRNGISGFYLATPDIALPWLRSNDVISSDELALVVLGDPPCTTSLVCCKATLPCKDEHDRDVLIAVNIFQLGQKKVTFREFDKHIIDVATSSLVALTLWKDDWFNEWDFISKHTFAHIRSIFQLDAAIVSIWGRSFRKGKSNTSPSDATSCQVHCTIKEGSLSQFLQASGINLIWATPKTHEGRPSLQFRLLWLKPDVSFAEAIVLCAKIRGSLGLHRGKDTLAIRVSRVDFPAAWKEIYPHDTLPCDVEAAHMFKLEVLPFGTTAATLLEWADHHKWPLKPIRALGPRSWLVGSPSLPPDSLHFNGSPILARQLPPKTQHAVSPIIAGPKPSSTSTVTPPGLSPDPWAAWTGPRLSSTAGPPANRVLTGPVETKLTEQNDRIVKLESSIQQLQAEQTKHSDALQQTSDDIRKRDQQLRSHMDSRLGDIRKELDATFTSALQQQSKTFESGMMELKSLLTQGKSKRKNENSDMEP